jgi:hypothetical protein
MPGAPYMHTIYYAEHRQCQQLLETSVAECPILW